MTHEFLKRTPNSVESIKGFTVTFTPPGGINYFDGHDTFRIDSEVITDPLAILLYPKSGDLRFIEKSRADAIVADIIRALKYLGHRVETWN